MAISLKASGTWARLVADGAVTIPGSPAAGDRMFLFGTWKTYTITIGTITGWTPLGAEYADGTTASGNGIGSVKVHGFYRDWQSGDGNPTVDYSANPTEGHWVIQVWQKGAAETWDTPVIRNAPIANTDPWNATATSTVTVPSGGVVIALAGINDNWTTCTRQSDSIDDNGEALVTWNGNYVESPATHFTSTTGDDMAGDMGHRFVTTGASGVTLHADGTQGGADTGAALFVVQGLVSAPTATGALALPAVTMAGTGTQTLSGTAAVSLPAVTMSGAATQTFTGTGEIVLPAATAAGIATQTFSATSEVLLASATVTATGTETFTATGDLVLPGVVVAGVGDNGVESFDGTGTLTLPGVTVEGTGVLTFTGSGDITLPAITASGAGTLTYTGTGSLSLPAVTVASSGIETFSATGEVVLAALSASGTGTETFSATGELVLSSITVNGFDVGPQPGFAVHSTSGPGAALTSTSSGVAPRSSSGGVAPSSTSNNAVLSSTSGDAEVSTT